MNFIDLSKWTTDEILTLQARVTAELRKRLPLSYDVLIAQSGPYYKPMCKAAEFGCECGRSEYEECPLPHSGAGKMKAIR